MFVISTPALVLTGMREGAIGAIPALNMRTTDALDEMLLQFNNELAANDKAAPYAINLITHKTNKRFESDLEVIARHKAPIVITSVGSPKQATPRIHDYGGLIFADVASIRHAQKAAAANVDGMVLLCAGAGGQTGRLNPFAFIAAVREFFDGVIAVAGSITNGRQLAALQVAGADLGYTGTPFIAARESNASKAYQQSIIASTADDVLETDRITGIPSNILPPTAQAFDIRPETRLRSSDETYDVKAIKWSKDLMTAGHGVGAVKNQSSCANIVNAFAEEYAAYARA